MGLSVVAEGVGDQRTVGEAANDGCDYAQGYYFAKPMPVKNFISILTAQIPPQTWKTASGLNPLHSMDSALLVVDEDEGLPCPGSTFSDCFKVLGGRQRYEKDS